MRNDKSKKAEVTISRHVPIPINLITLEARVPLTPAVSPRRGRAKKRRARGTRRNPFEGVYLAGSIALGFTAILSSGADPIPRGNNRGQKRTLRAYAKAERSMPP